MVAGSGWRSLSLSSRDAIDNAGRDAAARKRARKTLERAAIEIFGDAANFQSRASIRPSERPMAPGELLMLSLRVALRRMALDWNAVPRSEPCDQCASMPASKRRKRVALCEFCAAIAAGAVSSKPLSVRCNRRPRRWRRRSKRIACMLSALALGACGHSPKHAYEIDGNAAWKPLRAFRAGERTVVQMPAKAQHAELPVLFVLRCNEERGVVTSRLVERVDGPRYLVDCVVEEARLVAAVGGAQQQVSIKKQEHSTESGHEHDKH